VQWTPKDASFLQQSALWPFKVVQGHPRSMILVPIKGAYIRLPISRSLWLWCYLAQLLEYGDLLAKNCVFFLPLSHSAPSLPIFLLEFRTEVNRQETTVMGLSYSEDLMVAAWVVLTQCQRVPDRRTNLL